MGLLCLGAIHSFATRKSLWDFVDLTLLAQTCVICLGGRVKHIFPRLLAILNYFDFFANLVVVVIG